MTADWLAFRRFALDVAGRPAIGIEGLGPDPARDVLQLSLLSAQDFFVQTQGLRRPDATRLRLVAGYLDCTSPNAFAAERDGVHLCGLHVGIAVACFEFALFCLAQARLFPDIGQAEAEASPAPVDDYPPGFWMREAGAALDRADFLATASALMPRCPERYATAVFLMLLMTRFVWLHELYHCVNGHVGWAGARGWRFGFQETEPAQLPVPPETLLHLELDADQSAFHTLCRIGPAGLENVEGLQRLDEALQLRLAIVAGFATLWITQAYAARNAAAAAAGHPPAHARLQNLARTLASTIVPSIDGSSAVCATAFADMDRLAAILASFPSTARLTAGLGDATLQAALDREQGALAVLREELGAYRFS